MKELFDLRKEYKTGELLENAIPENPMTLFEEWFEEATTAHLSEPNAMVLATTNAQGIPSARVVLLKEINGHGFVFFTNYESKKGSQILENPNVALVFDWHEIERQVRIEGVAEKVSETDSDTYFNSRPLNSRLGAWTSPQSKVLKGRDELENLLKTTTDKFSDNEIQRPPHWGGYVVKPVNIEFWQGRPNRLHDRILFERTKENRWNIKRLAP